MIWGTSQLKKERSFFPHRNTDCLLVSMSSKGNKFVVNKTITLY